MEKPKLTNPTDESLLLQISIGNREAFTQLFEKYYRDLVMFGGTFIPDGGVCEDVVQDIFLRLWNNRESIAVETSVKSYLLGSVRNSCISRLRHRKVVDGHRSEILAWGILDSHDTENYVLFSDLARHLDEALAELPPKVRETFEMSRFRNLKYGEIACELNVSVRTVEVRVSRALEFLRGRLEHLFMLVIILIFKN